MYKTNWPLKRLYDDMTSGARSIMSARFNYVNTSIQVMQN